MAFYKVPSNIKIAILAFVRHILPKSAIKDIETLLSPCCKVSWTYTGTNCGFDGGGAGEGGVYGVVFTGSKIQASGLPNKVVTLIIKSTSFTGGVIQDITLDQNSSWTGTLYSSWESNPTNFDVEVYLLAEGHKTIVSSDIISLTGVQTGCD